MKITKDTLFFFDMDGTLIDTNMANFLSYQNALSNVMRVDTSFMVYNPMVRLTRNQIKLLFPFLTAAEFKSVISEKEKCYKKYISKTILIRENVDILLKYSVTNRLVLVSKGNKNRVEETLCYHNLLDKFSFVFYGDISVPPQAYNKYISAIVQLEISPQNIVAFEDEEDEVSDAKEAGIRIINPQNVLL